MRWRFGGCALIIGLGLSAPLHGQRLLDWTVHADALPEALMRGAAAVFWNPAAIAPENSRIDALLLDLQGPSDTGLNGVGAAGTLALKQRTFLGGGFQHLEVSGITVTDDAPVTPTDQEIDVSADRFTFAGAQPVGPMGTAGAMIQYERSVEGSDIKDQVTFGAGFRFASATHRLRPVVSGAAVVGGQTRWIAGADAALPLTLSVPLAFRVGYGITGGDRQSGVSHRGAVAARWQDRAAVTVSVAGEPGSTGTTFQPLVGAELRLGRYLLGVLREGMPNGFGATYSYRLNVRF